MKKHLLAAAAVFTCIFATISATSAQTATFAYDDSVGVPNAGTYAPGSSFTFSINLTFAPGGSVIDLDGFSYWFEQQNPNAPFFFTITSRDVTGSQFTDLQSPGLTAQPLTPSNVKDLGAFETNGLGFGPGTYFVAKITVSIDPSAAPGVYQIENTTAGGKTSIISDDQGHTAAIPQSVYTITVAPVPEPATLTLLVGGLAVSALVLARSRRNSG